jgi:hypothetical protein
MSAETFDLNGIAYQAILKYKNRPDFMKARTMSDLYKDGFNEGVKSNQAKDYWYNQFKEENEFPDDIALLTIKVTDLHF